MVQTTDIPVMALKEQITENHHQFWKAFVTDFWMKKERSSSKIRMQGFPTRKDEEYKYTNLKEITEKAYNFSRKKATILPKNSWIVFIWVKKTLTGLLS